MSFVYDLAIDEKCFAAVAYIEENAIPIDMKVKESERLPWELSFQSPVQSRGRHAKEGNILKSTKPRPS
jgi:hypothetical protein